MARFMSFITVAVQCHNYQRRFCWMLSSLCAQTKSDLLIVDVAHLANNGLPRTEDVIASFASRLKVKISLWTDYSQFQKRGLVRNRQLSECSTEWLLFADCDMVYHPQYFERLAADLTHLHAGARYMLSSGRISNPKEAAIKLVDSVSLERNHSVHDAFGLADKLPKIKRNNVGAGFSQIINVREAPHEGYYVPPEENRDWTWEKRHQKTKSDAQFRRRIARAGGPRQRLPRWYTDGLIHLNHHRDKEFGRHLADQR